MRLRAIAVIALVASSTALASPTTPRSPAACAAQAAAEFEVPREVIAAVWLHENGRVGKCSAANSNGSRDCGPMQVNTIQLGDYAHIGLTLERIRDDACVNFAVAADLLRKHYVATGSWYAAMGRYHSRTPEHATVYLSRIRNALERVRRMSIDAASASEPSL